MISNSDPLFPQSWLACALQINSRQLLCKNWFKPLFRKSELDRLHRKKFLVGEWIHPHSRFCHAPDLPPRSLPLKSILHLSCAVDTWLAKGDMCAIKSPMLLIVISDRYSWNQNRISIVCSNPWWRIPPAFPSQDFKVLCKFAG